MATALSPTLTNKDFINWLKGALAILIAKEGITDFVITEISKCHNCLLQLVPKANVCKSCSCTINSLPKCVSHRPHQHSTPTSGNPQLCSRGVCHILMDGICQNHRFREPSWKNTDPQKWYTDPYEIAKCYMPPDGYANKSSMAETDFNGTLAVIINNTSFQAKFQAQLATKPNICTKAREVGREIRHTADHLLSDSDLHRYIDDLINLLCDPAHLLNDPNAQVAVGKLKQLKANTLNISEHDITEVLNENIRETFSEQQQRYLQTIQNHYSQLQADSIVEIDRLVSIKKGELEDFTDKKKEEITKEVEAQTHAFSLKKTELEELTSKKKEEITKHVEDRTNDFSVQKTELDEFISKKKEEINKHVEDQTHDFSVKKTELNEFTNKKKDEITKYVEAQTHDFSLKKTELEEFSSKQKEDITRHVDKKTQEIETCVLYQTEKQVMSDLEKQEDGLDEWAHPSKCHKTPKVPHHNHPHTCTVLTTTRPWKLCIIGLSSTHIDRQAVISELDYERSAELEQNAFEILRRIPSATAKCIEDFNTAVASIGDICNNPYIKLHLMCLWYEGDMIGNSICEIYSNITELTLKRGLKKRDLPSIKANTSDIDLKLPKCFEKSNKSRMYIDLLFKLGKLAFFSLFSEINESMLIIDSETVKKYLFKREQQFCLKVGLLCQIKEVNQLVKICHKVYFQHKSIQEFFCALYIQWDWGNTLVPSTILKVCKSYSDVIEMSDVFVFVCGLNPEVYSDLFKQIQAVIERDHITCSYRTLISNHEHIIRAYQSIQFSCIEENIKNKNGECLISLQDIILDNPMSVLYLTLKATSGQIKSCYISNMWTVVLKDNNISVNITGENTSAEDTKDTIENLLSRFEQNIASTVQTLRIHSVLTENLRSSSVSTFLSGSVENLKYLSIYDLTVSSEDLELLYTILGKTNRLSGLSVAKICVRDRFHISQSRNRHNSTRIVLDLSLHSQLQTLYMNQIPNCDPLLRAEMLQHCELGDLSLLHDNIYKVITSLGSGKMLDKITLHTIMCLDHRDNCPGVPLKMCQDSQLRSLNLNDLSLDVLDLSKSRNFQKIQLSNISLRELHINSERLEICNLQLGKPLPYKFIKQVLSSIENGKMLEEFSISTQLCLDHRVNCPGVKLNLSKNINLRRLFLDRIKVHTLELPEDNKIKVLSLLYVPINNLDLSKSKYLRTIDVRGVPLRELTLNTDCLEHCTVHTELLLLSHDTINNLLNSLGSGSMLEQLSLTQIQCLDHLQSCPGVPLTFCNNSKIRQIDLCSVPISVLDISQLCQIYQVVLKNIPLCEFHTNTEYFSLCTFEAELSRKLPHATINQLFCSIGSCKMLKQLTLNHIQCSDHVDSCPGVSLTFCKASQIQQLTVSRASLDVLDLSQTGQEIQNILLQKISLHEFHTNTEFLQTCTFEAEFSVELPHAIIHKLFSSIGNCMMLTNVTLKQIQCLEHSDRCTGSPLVFCSRSKIHHITVLRIPLSVLDLSQTIQVQTIKVQNAPLCDLKVNSECLKSCSRSPMHHITVQRTPLRVLDLYQTYMVQTIKLQNAPFCDIHVNTECLKSCTLEAELSVELPHTTICHLMCSIGSCVTLTNIKLTQIRCLNHSYSCPGVPLEFCKNSQLQQLNVDKVPLSVLDLSKSVLVMMMWLQNVPLCELHATTNSLTSCILYAKLSTELPHTTIQQLLSSVGGCMMLKDITLAQMKCSDHYDNCPGSKMTFSKGSQLQQLSMHNVPLGELDLSQAGQINTIVLSNVPLRELKTSAEVIETCTLQASVLVNMSHNNLQQLFNSLKGCKALTGIYLQSVQCSDHPDGCPGVPLTFCENSQIQQIAMVRVPLGVLDLSKTSHVHSISLRDIPLRQLHSNTKWLNSCTLEAELSVALPHTNIEELLCSIGRCVMLSNIELKLIQCSDHHSSCLGAPLIFCKNSKLQKLNLISVPLSVLDLSQTGQVIMIQLQRMPLRELHTVSECLQQCILEADLSFTLSHNIIEQLFCSIGSCMTLSNLTVKHIQCSDHAYGCLGVPLTCINSQLQHLTVSRVPVSVLDLSEAGHVKTIKIQNIPMCELKTNNDCLHSCTLEADMSVKLSHNSIHQLLSSIGKCITLSDITLKQIQCSDHPGSCSNVPFTFCENSQLQHLNLFQVPISVLDISQSDQVETIELKNIPLCEMRMNNECLQLCKMDAVLSAILSHNKIEQLLCSIGSCKMLTHITLKDITCSDHPYSCSGVPLIFVNSSELVSLSICSVPVSVLDLSQTGPVEKIELQKIPLCELHTINACLNSCTFDGDLSIKLPHNKIRKLFHSIGSCFMLTYLTLKNIECSDHLDRCPGVDLAFGKNSELILLTLNRVPVSVLDLFQAGKLKKLQLQDIPLCELHTNTEYVNACTLKADMSIMLTQNNIKRFILSIGRGNLFEELTINNRARLFIDMIHTPSDETLKMCHDSQLRKLTLSYLAFSGLDLSQTKQIEEINLSSMYFNELYINTDHLQKIAIDSTSLSHKSMQEVFSTIEKGEFLKQLTFRCVWCLDHRNCCPGVEINLSMNDDLQTLILSDVPVSALDLPKSHKLHSFRLNFPYNIEMFRTSYLKEVIFSDDPIRELDINNDFIRKCVALSHNSIVKLFADIGSCAMLEVLALKQIFCSDHLESCPGVEMKFCQDSQLQQLTVYRVPISVLDFSHASQLITITLQNIPLSELHTNSEWLTLDVVSVKLSHTTIHHLICSVGSCSAGKLTLAKIQCLDHPKSCPGVPMTFHQKCKLTYLTICRVPISVLDLSQAGEVNTIRLKNIPLCEIHPNTGCLKLCTLDVDLSNKLPHNYVDQFLSFIGKCVMLSDISLKNIQCSNHPDRCFDVPLNFCKYSQQQKLNLYTNSFGDFQFSHGNQVKKIKLQNLPLCAIHTYIECLQPCTLEVCLSVELQHETIQKLFSFIGSCTMLSAITLKSIQCLDHPENCTGVPLIFCKNCKLQQLFAIKVPISALDLSQTDHVKPMQPLNIPPCDLYTNSERPQACTLEVDLSVKLLHIDIQKLFSSIGNCIIFSKITLKHVHCLDHPENCPGAPLIFCKNSNLQQLKAINVPISALDLSQIDHVETIQLQKTPLSELHTNTKCLQPCKLEADLSVKLSHNTIQKLFNSIGDCIKIKELNLKQIQCFDHTCSCPGVPLRFCTNSFLQHLSLSMVPLCLLDLSHVGQLQDLHLENVPLNKIDLLQACDLKRLQLTNVKLSLAAWTALFSSLRNLPLLNQVDLYKITMSASDWKELLTLMFTGTLAHNTRLSVESCAEPSPEQWENIATELKALSVTAQFGGNRCIFNKTPIELKSTENHELFFW